jgi:hypothetical protein
MRKIKYSIATTRETFTKKKVICEWNTCFSVTI